MAEDNSPARSIISGTLAVKNPDLRGATALKSVEINGLYCQDIDVSGCENLKTLKLNGLYSDVLLKGIGSRTIYVGEKNCR